MRLIRNRILPIGRNYGAINLFGTVFYKPEMKMTPRMINHEAIHSRQMRELLYLPFYLLYVLEWLVRLVQFRGNSFQAYKHISHEMEAYSHDADPDYLRRRRPFAMWRRNN